MRTVSFSSDKVRKLLNDDFQCATVNTDGDPTAGMSSAHAPGDSCGRCSRGIGKQNVQCLFLTPKGNIFHVASGFVGPKDLEKELRFALQLHKDIRKKPESAKGLVAARHRARLKTLGFNTNDVRSPRSRSTARDLMNQMFTRHRGANGRVDLAQLRRMAAEMRNRNSRSRSRGGRSVFGDGDNFHQSRNSGIFAFKSKRTVLNDHKFCIEQPLMPYSEFERRPQVLVGNEKTAFSSSGPGGASGGRIGGN